MDEVVDPAVTVKAEFASLYGIVVREGQIHPAIV